MNRFLWKYPTRSRPDLFQERLINWLERLGVHKEDHHRWVITIDESDETMNNPKMLEWIKQTFEEFSQRFRGTLDYSVYVLTNSGKISACNAGVNEELEVFDADFISLVSDDMVLMPEGVGIGTKIAEEILRNYPDGDAALHINDGLQGMRLCTFSCMGRKFYDRFGYLYHPDYVSTHCDDEFTQLAWGLRRMIWVPEVWVKHDWVGNTRPDEMHQKNHALMSRDAQVYQERVKRQFPKDKIVRTDSPEVTCTLLVRSEQQT